MSRVKKSRFFYLLAVLLLILADMGAKRLAALTLKGNGVKPFLPGFLQLRYTENTGAAFSFLSGARWFLVIAAAVAILVIIYIIIFSKRRGRLFYWALTFMAAGGLGNLIDRAAAGYVVDFFEFTFVRFAVFNLADIFINAGVILLALYVLVFYKNDDTPPLHGGEA